MIFNQEKEFKTAKEFIDFFQTHSFFRTSNKWETHNVGRAGHIYRGQTDSNWKLYPSVFRSHDSLKGFTLQTPGSEYTEKTNKSWLGWHLHAELRAVFIFLETADKLGIETPIDYSKLRDHDELINAALNEKDYDYSSPFPTSQALEEFALAQHHGVPTRILDWTESPLIACYFAALGASSIINKKDRVTSEYIAVNCFNTHYFSKSEEIIKVNAPRHRNNFLRLQQGVFTHTPKANSYLLEHGSWPCVEDIIKNTKVLNGALKKYYLPSSEADNLLKELYDYGITTHHLMPTLDNIARSHSYAAHLFK